MARMKNFKNMNFGLVKEIFTNIILIGVSPFFFVALDAKLGIGQYFCIIHMAVFLVIIPLIAYYSHKIRGYGFSLEIVLNNINIGYFYALVLSLFMGTLATVWKCINLMVQN